MNVELRFKNKHIMKKLLYSLMLVLMILPACKDEGRLDHIDDAAPAPAQVASVSVENLPGGAVLRYKFPADKNLLYVKAVYETTPGRQREAKASLFVDSLVLDGFAAAGSYPVKIYSVGRNEKLSEPVIASVDPLSPPIELTFPTLQMSPTFGGIKITYENAARGDLAVVLMVDTLGGVWRPLQTFYTNQAAGAFAQRGLKTNNMKFGLYLRDRWNNKSDTLVAEIEPGFEEEIPKSTWTKYSLAGDTDAPAENNETAYGLKNIWDGIIANPYTNVFATLRNQAFPMTFTVSLGKTVTLSRIVVHHRKNMAYAASSPRAFELYGSNVDTPGADLFGGDWTLLGKFRSKDAPDPIQPSDREEAEAKGLNFDLEAIPGVVDNPWIPVKYIRFRSMESYASNLLGQIIIAEIELYGKVEQ